MVSHLGTEKMSILAFSQHRLQAGPYPESEQWQRAVLARLRAGDVHDTLLEVGSWGRQESILLSALWPLLAQRQRWVQAAMLSAPRLGFAAC